ncbi:MAG: hypothetical protein KatS3mg058_1557 [Roseiflexus sp.]|nr:MAG: hypothetical protein KatS3mg058_1557 [Roseiflexus sp.]
MRTIPAATGFCAFSVGMNVCMRGAGQVRTGIRSRFGYQNARLPLSGGAEAEAEEMNKASGCGKRPLLQKTLHARGKHARGDPHQTTFKGGQHA